MLRRLTRLLRAGLLRLPVVSAELDRERGARAIELGDLRVRVEELERARGRLLRRARRDNSAIPVVVGFDIEPDRRVVDLTDPTWRFTPVCLERWELLRADLRPVAIPTTWFMRADPQVEKANGAADFALRHFAAEWARVQSLGDELGLHMHPWRWNDTLQHWSQDHGDEQWILYCLRMALNAFSGAFGAPPRSYRGGDRFLTPAVAEALMQAGVEVDLTLERMPGVERLAMDEHGTGTIPDGSAVPPHAYFASHDDVRVPAPKARGGLGILPLTSFHAGTLVPWTPHHVFVEELDRLISASERPTHLAFIARADLAHLPEWDAFAANIRSLAERAEEGELVFLTATDTWTRAKQVLGAP